MPHAAATRHGDARAKAPRRKMARAETQRCIDEKVRSRMLRFNRRQRSLQGPAASVSPGGFLSSCLLCAIASLRELSFSSRCARDAPEALTQRTLPSFISAAPRLRIRPSLRLDRATEARLRYVPLPEKHYPESARVVPGPRRLSEPRCRRDRMKRRCKRPFSRRLLSRLSRNRPACSGKSNRHSSQWTDA